MFYIVLNRKIISTHNLESNAMKAFEVMEKSLREDETLELVHIIRTTHTKPKDNAIMAGIR